MKTSRKAGFTLIELSIVLVIIGLLIGGVLTGKDLIRAAEIRSISTQKEAIVSAVYTFKNIYNAIPGDMIDAQSIWGAATDCVTAQTTQATCNGNGSGTLDSNPENFLFWKHLSNAGLVAGNFIGITDGGVSWSATSKNTPSGKISGSLWFAVNWSRATAGNKPWLFDGAYNHSLYFGLYLANGTPDLPVLTAQETFALDSKIDDGKPGTGNLRNIINTNYTCATKADGSTPATSADANTAVYKISSSGNQCAFAFPNLF